MKELVPCLICIGLGEAPLQGAVMPHLVSSAHKVSPRSHSYGSARNIGQTADFLQKKARSATLDIAVSSFMF